MRHSTAIVAVMFAITAAACGKYLDDRQSSYGTAPITVGGTNAYPQIGFPACYDPRDQGYFSPLTSSYAETDRNNNRTVLDARDGLASKVKAFAMEADFDIAGWTVTDRFRFSDISGAYDENAPFVTETAPFFTQFGEPTARLRYATGPLSARIYADLESLGIVASDLRAAGVWEVGEGKIRTTAGVYNSRQDIRLFWNFTSTLQDLAGGGRNAPTNINTATVIPATDAGALVYGFAVGRPFSINHPEKQKQAAEATLEVTRTGEDTSQPEVGASAQWTSASRENVSGTSTVTSRQASSGSADCITVTDVVIIEGEETRAEKQMCRAPGSARHLILF